MRRLQVVAGTALALSAAAGARWRALERHGRADLGRLTDCLPAPVLFGIKCWVDALLGYRPEWTDEPEPV